MKYSALCFLLSFFLLTGLAYGQEQTRREEMKDLRFREMQRYKAMMTRQADAAASETRIDVTYYLLDLTLTTSPQYLNGRVVMNAVSLTDNLAGITLDLMNAMHVDSVRMGGVAVDFTQHSSSFDIQLDHEYNNGDPMTVEIFYQGHPGSSGFGSFEFSTHGSATPWVWSLSEPFGAKDWWPCKDHPSDKADSADIIVTVNAAFKTGSNGKLLSSTDNGDGTITYHWHESYPIPTYLISIAVTNYSQFSNWFKYSPTDSMEVLNYVLPEHLASAQANLPYVLDGLRIYSNLFGLYPFIREKYGHSEFGWGGGMEHETMTSLGGFGESLTMHELAHQWFGDMITCRTWPDIWLNEGFATYCEVLYEGTKYGSSSYWGEINGDMASAKNATGTISVSDSGGTLFSSALVYSKGAVVLHMLRHVVGDSAFFHGMYNYANNPALRYSTASTADFRASCEGASGMDLNYFFNEWIYGQNYPTYSLAYSSNGNHLSVTLGQTTGTTNPAFFTMPVDLKFTAAGWDTTATVWNNVPVQTFTFNLSHHAAGVQIDPNNWILKSVVAPVFSASTDTLNLGTVLITESHTDSITISNPGSTSLLISSVVSDESTFTVTPSIGNIPGGGSRKYYITFTPDSFGVRTGHIIFTYNESASPSRITVTGFCEATTALFLAQTDSLNLGYAVVNGIKTDSIRITNAGATPLEISSASCDSGSFSITPATATLQAMEERMFVVSFHPVSVGVKTGHIIIVHNGTSSPDSIAVTGTCGTMTVAKGWNMVSVPFLVPHPEKDSLFTFGVQHAYKYSTDTGYVIEDSLRHGRGYWIKCTAPNAVIINGEPVLAETINVVPGWNLIGSISLPLKTTSIISDPPAVITSRFYGYCGHYTAVDTIQPGKGYWIKVNQHAKLILSSFVHFVAGQNIIIVPTSELPPSAPETITEATTEHPEVFSLSANYPNPFNPSTVIRYTLPQSVSVTLSVCNTLGQEVAVLVHGVQEAGYHTATFDANINGGLPSGVYIYRLTAGTFSETRKMILMR